MSSESSENSSCQRKKGEVLIMIAALCYICIFKEIFGVTKHCVLDALTVVLENGKEY